MRMVGELLLRIPFAGLVKHTHVVAGIPINQCRNHQPRNYHRDTDETRQNRREQTDQYVCQKAAQRQISKQLWPGQHEQQESTDEGDRPEPQAEPANASSDSAVTRMSNTSSPRMSLFQARAGGRRHCRVFDQDSAASADCSMQGSAPLTLYDQATKYSGVTRSAKKPAKPYLSK